MFVSGQEGQAIFQAQSEELLLYRRVFESATDAIAILDPQGRYVRQNEVHRQLTGYSDEEVLGKTPAIHLGEEVFAEVAAALAASDEYRGELTSTTKSGARRQIDLHAFTIRNPAGDVLFFVGIKRDLTVHRRAEQALRVRAEWERVIKALLCFSREELSATEQLTGALKELLLVPWLDLAPHGGIYLLDGDVQRLAARCNLTVPQDERARGECPACGRPLRRVEPCPADADWPRGHLVIPIVLGDEPLGSLLVFPRATSTIAQQEFLGAVGSTLGGMIVRQRVVSALRESEARFMEMCGSLPGVVYQFELQPDGTRRFPFVSHAIADLFQLTVEEVLADGDAPFRRMHPDDLEGVLTSIDTSARTLTTWDSEFRIIQPDGRITWLHGTSNPRRNASGSIVWTGVVMDVSKRKRAEAELRQAMEAAEEATRAKSQFLANVSHELRTPMNAVIGMAGLLADSRLTPEQMEYATTIRSSADALLLLINDLLDVTKIESEKITLEQRPFDLRECIESSLSLLASRAAEKGIGLTYLFEGEHVPARVVGDSNRVRQILVNLISNGVKFTREGEVVITVGARPLEEGRSELQFAVRDTGVGIPADRMNRLFKAFSQVDPSTTREYGGTGLGLAISKRLCELMGGSMWAESEVGRGSTFSFTLSVEVGGEVAPAPPKPFLSGRRVLIVDDNAHSRRRLQQRTRAWGMIPAEAASGREALEQIAHAPFDVAIVDQELSGDIDGPGLIGHIRALPGPGRLSLVMLRPVGPRAVVTPGLSGFLLKPVRDSQLLTLLTSIFASSIGPAGDGRLEAERAERRPVRILLVEDHSVNQRVALGLLARLGYQADVANDGREAVESLARDPYDLVLMDVQMPRMDGLDSTREIRRRWGEGGPRIVAMTASATPEDRRRCLEAGMNEYLSKPVRLGDLRDVIERLLPPGPPECVDAQVLAQLRAVQAPGAPDLATELIELFLEDTPPMLATMRTAVDALDPDTLQRPVHSLKGCSGNLGARQLGALCGELEGMARAGDLSQADPLLTRLEAEYARVAARLRDALTE